MTETGPATPDTEIRPRRRILSAVWIVPIIALIFAVGIVYQSYRNQGVLVAISFPDASGIEIGQTTLRYREVVVGVVEDVGFSNDLTQVNVYVRVNQAIAPYLDDDASFWIVQPEVTTRGVSGLNTILSGTYIEGTWDNEIGLSAVEFEGDERAPIVPPGVEGTAITLRARDSSRLGPGAPILYRGIEVGEVATPRLSNDGTEIRIDAFVLAPYDRQLSTSTRFWDASGVSAELGAGGVELRIGSLAAIVEGGVNFDTLISGGTPIGPGHVFNIFADENDARASTFETPSARSVGLSTLFPSAAAGLSEGAVVRYNGVRVGTVSRVAGFIRPDDPQSQVQLLAVLAIQPAKMGLQAAVSDLEGIDFIGDLVRDGLRAQLTTTSLFGGDLAIELVDTSDTSLEGLEIGVADNPLIPTVEAEEGALQAGAAGVMERIENLPIEEIMASANDLLDNLNRIAGNPDTRAIPGEVLTLLEDGQGLVRDGRAIVASPEVAGVLLDVQTIAGDLRDVMETIAEREVAATLASTLEAGEAAATAIAEGTAELDGLVDAGTLALDAVGVLLEDEGTRALPGLAAETLEGARDLTTGPELAAILADTAAAMADVREITNGFTDTPLAPRIDALLTNVDIAAANVAAGTADLGSLRRAIGSVVDAAETLMASADTQALPTEALGLLRDGRGLVGGPEARALLTNLTTVSNDISLLTRQLIAEDAAASLTAALDAAADAATSVAEGTRDLPELSASAQRILRQAETLSVGLTDLTAKANDLPIEDLLTSATALSQSAEAFLTTDEASDIPVALVDTLEELRLTIEAVRTGGTIETLNATLRSASGAADGIRATAEDLPALVARLQTVIAQAGGVLGAYGADSRINQELNAALRAATRAAEDVSSLSKTIERNPQSLILGR